MRYVIGVDEVGRGPLAGPVEVCALLMPKGLRFSGLKDSKKLSAKAREEWFERIVLHPRIEFEVARVYPQTIDRKGIARAANLAAFRAYSRLIRRVRKKHDLITDYGLRFPEGVPYKSFIKGDEKFVAIRMASIVAKVDRDRYMTKLHENYPKYGFNRHKGYGTTAHKRAILKFGPCDAHRLSFIGGIVKD